MNQIIFKKTSNVFLNTGIISLHYYLERYKEEIACSDEVLFFELTNNSLMIRSNKLLDLLEVLYYQMGREVYDTSGKNAREKVDKFFFIKHPFKAEPFAKMKTYGLGELLTNDATPIASKNGKKIKFERLIKEDNAFAIQIADFLHAKGKKLKFFSFVNDGWTENEETNGKRRENTGGESEIFIDAGYTKTPELDFDKKYFESGEEVCYLSGERRKRLLDTINNTAFSNFSNFSSFLRTSDKRISWESAYLVRFAPRFTFYMYISGLDSLVCYLFESNDLLTLKKYYRNYSSFFKSEFELIDSNYLSNFKLHAFRKIAKDSDQRESSNKDFTEQFEILFMLIYTLYRSILYTQSTRSSQNEVDTELDLFDEAQIIRDTISLVSFKANKFAGKTFRPDSFENFNQFKFTIRLIKYLENNKVRIDQLMSSLKFLKTSDKNSKNSYRLERQIRNEVLGKILKQQSILQDMETLFYNCFTYLNSGEYVGFKNYSLLLNLVSLYQPIINKHMEKETAQHLQERAIDLGYSIGISILNYDGGEKQANAKQARTYIIGLHKSRTPQQFREALIRIQTKYGLRVNNDILGGLNEDTFEFIKQFAVISALNLINSVLHPKSDK